MNSEIKLPILIGTAILKINHESLNISSPSEFLLKIKKFTKEDKLLKYLNDWISITLSNINATIFFNIFNSISNLTPQEIM